MNRASLHEAVAAAAPIEGVRVGKPADRATWSIDFRDEATDAERAAAQAAMDAWSEPAERRKVLKSVIIARLTDQQLEAALAAMTTRQKERWRAPAHPSIYADDPEAVELVRAVGADPAAVLAP